MHGLDSSSINSANAGDKLADYFAELAGSLGLQTNLRQMNIKLEALEDLARQSMDQQRLLINNPREVGLADALEIYQQAY